MDYKQIDSFEKALEVKGETLEQFNERTKDMDVDTVGYEKVKVIAFAINGGKHVKEGYYPWFYNPTGSSRSFSVHAYAYDYDGAVVGARLSVDTSEKALYMGRQFTDIYTRHLSPEE